jgi:hypothetical protein
VTNEEVTSEELGGSYDACTTVRVTHLTLPMMWIVSTKIKMAFYSSK